MSRRVVVIGSGLGGLVTSYLLSKQGDCVTILEHDKRPGGSLQAFYRDGIRFDTGFHFVGGMAEGGPLYPYFHDLGLDRLAWTPLDGHEIWLGDKQYVIPNGQERWLRYMQDLFPHQKTNIDELLRVCREAVECPLQETMPYWEQNAWQWLEKTIDDPILRDLISGSSMLVELNRETLPLFAFAEIVYSYVYSSHRLREGGAPIIEHLLGGVLAHGGSIRCSSTVIRILEKDGRAAGVQLQSGEVIEADIVLSAIHPQETMNLLSDNTSMRKVYRRRIDKLVDSMGSFTANIKFRKGSLSLRDVPIYVHKEGADIWSYNAPPVEHLLLHSYPEQDAMDIIVPMAWTNVAQWDGTQVGHRGQDYELFKKEILSQCLALAETALPGITDAVEQVWTSTPLTWKNYFLSHNGTSYGVCKDCNAPESTILMPKTPLPGLFLTGQSMILHGIMGTTISGFISAQFLGATQPPSNSLQGA
ncbi:MAG: NAD(P)/FAD-dependent oxidoreductase [Paludibacteraceae bacterium]|nr:NAD(P)/FAD-dependent oxidoreductase [Paludibacteraceae bacterium]